MNWLNLRDYQRKAITQMRNGCILCGGVGSGKSRTSLAYYFKEQGGNIDSERYEKLKHEPQDLYIITTARKRDTLEWDAELIPFLMNRDQSLSPYNNQVIVDSWNNLHKYRNTTNAFFIFDEQRVVGYGAWTKSFLKIAKHNNWILLSATPGDKWEDYIPVFIANGFYENKTDFVSQHMLMTYRKRYPEVLGYVSTGRLIRLRNRILVDMDFHRSTIQHHETIMCDYDRLLYKQVMKTRWNIYSDEPLESASELCFCLRRITNSDFSRGEKILELIQDHPKSIIFYSYDYELDILKSLPYPDGMIIAEWNGHKHEEIPDSDAWVYLVQYTAGCEGWNCIKTDTVIFYSQQYSYKVLEQARGRIDRMNTPYKDLYYYHLRSTAKIDIAIARAIDNKKKFNEGRFVERL